MMDLFQCCLLAGFLIVGMILVYLIRYWDSAGRKIGLWKMM